jgi:hypothetical protein
MLLAKWSEENNEEWMHKCEVCEDVEELLALINLFSSDGVDWDLASRLFEVKKGQTAPKNSGMSDGNSPWNLFQRQKKGLGYTQVELKTLYRTLKEDESEGDAAARVAPRRSSGIPENEDDVEVDAQGGPVRGDDASKEVVVDSFCCPLTMKVLWDPVITADGQTYERTEIEKWFERGGSVTSITMTSGGSGYTSPPTIRFTGGGGTGASAVVDTAAIVSTSVSAVEISAGGIGYKSAPTVVFTGGGGSGASATAIVKRISPKTGAELSSTILMPNIALKNAIEEVQKKSVAD